MKVKTLDWTHPAPPNEIKCLYDHVKAQTPFGEFSIEWKSWKQYDSYTIYFNGDFVMIAMSLEEAKVMAQNYFNNTVMDCLEEE